MADAADAVPPVLVALAPVACRGLDARHRDVRADGRPAATARGRWLFVELTDDDLAEPSARAAECRGRRPAWRTVVTDAAEQLALWRIREDGAGLAAVPGGRPAQAGWEDAAVPPERLGDYLRDFEALLYGHGLRGVPYGHFGDGCVHCASTSTRTATRVGGVSPLRRGRRRPGCGARWLDVRRARRRPGPLRIAAANVFPAALALFAAVKRLFDPDNLLNPGVLVEPAPLTRICASLPARVTLVTAWTGFRRRSTAAPASDVRRRPLPPAPSCAPRIR